MSRTDPALPGRGSGERRGSGSRRGRGRPSGTSAGAIVAVALEIADREGLDALTMQRLAAAVGVGTMTLYGYFPSKAKLLDAIIDEAVEGGHGIPHYASWRDELHAVVSSVHAVLSRHPALVEIRFRRPILRPEALRFGERCLSVLLRAGFPPAEASSVFRLLFTYVFGFSGLSPQRRAGQAREEAASAIASLPAARYPSLTAHRDEFSEAMAGQERFDYGLQRILDGLEARAADGR